jgi:enoyl-CoA hydratase/carnithine racemase
MFEEMDDALTLAVSDDKVGAVILSGKGVHFSSGHDSGISEEMYDCKETTRY